MDFLYNTKTRFFLSDRKTVQVQLNAHHCDITGKSVYHLYVNYFMQQTFTEKFPCFYASYKNTQQLSWHSGCYLAL